LLDGGPGADFLNGGGGDDLIIYRPGDGADTVFGFVTGAGSEDRISLSAFVSIGSLADVLALATQVNTDTVIKFCGGATPRLRNCVPATRRGADCVCASPIWWQNDTGAAAIWLMDGFTVLAGANVGSNPGPMWHVEDSGDYNGDGKSDILWQNNDGTP